MNVIGSMGATVRTMISPNAGHGIAAEEAAWLRGRMNAYSVSKEQTR
ncbi:MAG: hypothetical protein WBF53_11350 [Litorimonas sp.]